MKVFPSTEVGLRAIPAICGVALVPVAYWIGRELASTRAATIAAALVASNPFLVWYSQEARSYSLLALLSAIALLLTLRALRRPSGRLYAGWMVVSSLALATHYFAAFLVLPEAVILLNPHRGAEQQQPRLGSSQSSERSSSPSRFSSNRTATRTGSATRRSLAASPSPPSISSSGSTSPARQFPSPLW